MKFDKEFLKKILWGVNDVAESVSDTIVDTNRWSVISELVFKFDGRFYRTTYHSQGSTEKQDELPFQYESDEIECQEVKQAEKVVVVWEAVK